MVARHLPEIVVTENIHLTIANGENAAAGFGITPQLADEIFGFGVDVITSGNHIWDKREIYDYLPKQPRLLRPANYAAELPGSGVGSRRGAQRSQLRRAESARASPTCRPPTARFARPTR